jgi:rhamnogalacturonan acetylesterase
MNRLFACLTMILLIFCSFVLLQKDKPVFYIIGDSTVRNGDGSGKNQQWGWGSFIAGYFDTTKLSVSNQAIGGRSSRTFITEGRWDRIITELKKGDYVIMQFGHNDAGPLDDTARARGTIQGIGEESKDIYNPITKKEETVHTYGWYMRKYIRETKAKGAIAIVCSPVPRDSWKDGKVNRSTESYTKWAREVAKEEQCFFIDLNDLIAIEYEALGAEKVKAFFPADHTHTDKAGAELNASVVIRELKKISSLGLSQFLNR